MISASGRRRRSMRILVATTRREAVDELRAALGRRHALEGTEPARLLAALAAGGWDLALIDRVPGADELCEQVRAAHRALPVMVLTPEGDVAARVRALEGGADDALAAPWAASQLAARVGALGRRAALSPADAEEVCADGCTIDLGRATCERDGREIHLTAGEVALIRWLLRHSGRGVGRAELLQQVWGVAPTVTTRAVDVAVAALRRKIERDPASPCLVVSVRGVGYAWGPGVLT